MPWGDQSQNKYLRKACEKAMEPRINDPLYNEVAGITNYIRFASAIVKYMEKELRYNETSL